MVETWSLMGFLRLDEKAPDFISAFVILCLNIQILSRCLVLSGLKLWGKAV